MGEWQRENERRRANRKSGIKIMACIFLVAFLGMFGIIFLTSQLSLIEVWYVDMMSVEYADISYMDNIEQLLHKHEAYVFEHMVVKDSETKKELMEQTYEVKEQINNLLAEFGENMKGREYEPYFHSIYSAIGSYFNRIDIIFDFSEHGEIATAEYYMNLTLTDTMSIVNERVEELKQLINDEMEKQNERMLHRLSLSRKTVTAALIVILAFSIIAHWSCGKLTDKIVSIDPLTGIHNADSMEEYLVKLKKRKKLSQYVSMLINIKDFNFLNRQFGTYAGDCVLREYAQKLKGYLKKTEFCSRQSGDTFMVLVRQENVDDFLKLLKVVPVEIRMENGTKNVKLKSRCAIYPIQEEDNTGDIINNLSVTLNDAKRSGKKDQVWFSEKQYRKIMENKRILAQFAQGVQNEEFVVYYQPKVSARTKQLCGCEALVRWVHEGEMVPPGKFIPILEDEGKVVELDFYVFEHVCRDIAEWVRNGIEPVRISSNFSKLHLQNKNLAEDILSIMKKYDIDPKYVELELTESSGYEDLVMLKSFVKKMNQEHVHTSMDDFGTGYSSLSMLKDVNVDVVKLDKSFLNGVDQGDESKKKMITHLIHMIQDLERTVVCEGVETEKEFEFLKDVDCDMIQGYLFDKPLPHDEFEKRLLEPSYS